MTITPETSRAAETAWKVRAWDNEDIERAFVDESVIAVSNDEPGFRVDTVTPAELRERLAAGFPDRGARAMGIFLTYWTSFVHEMKVGDVVAVPLGGRRFIAGNVSSAYRYVPSEPRRWLRHVRDVTWWGSPVSRDRLDADLRRVIGAPGTIGQIHAQSAATRLRRIFVTG